MTQEEKDLLLKDLCGRLPYEVKINCFDVARTLESICIDREGFITIDCGGDHFYHPFSNKLHDGCLPYLRPMSSMTNEEKEELRMEHEKDERLLTECIIKSRNGDNSMRGKVISHYAADWCNRNHFDYRGLIPMGLALEAPEGIYN